MRKFLFLALACALLADNGSGLAERRDHQHRAAHWIRFRNSEDQVGCSATAVGPGILLTAHHCLLPVATVFLDGDKTPHYVQQTIADDRDSILVVLSDRPFKDWINLTSSRPAKQGERLYFWGNPQGLRDQLRVGYLSGSTIRDDDTRAPGALVYIMVAPTRPGDSGAAIYGNNGRLVGVVSYSVLDGSFVGYYAPDFTDEQLAQAGL